MTEQTGTKTLENNNPSTEMRLWNMMEYGNESRREVQTLSCVNYSPPLPKYGQK